MWFLCYGTSNNGSPDKAADRWAYAAKTYSESYYEVRVMLSTQLRAYCVSFLVELELECIFAAILNLPHPALSHILSLTHSRYWFSPIGPPTLRPVPEPTNAPTVNPTFYPTISPTITGEYKMFSSLFVFVFLLSMLLMIVCFCPVAARPTDKPVIDPNDPSFTFYCGKSWAEADEKCPIRCPSGGSQECPA